ncbi:MAG: ABC transporter permease, partial [Candidatus Marinimicrobia bacterium]|nr:ABC transporter permease [Candidatus Neomarinimicrobiota bacterium]
VFANKVRSFLTMLGIIIGILSVSLMGTAISGIDAEFNKSVDMMGQNVLYIQKFPWFMGNDDWWDFRNRPDLKEIYVEKILERSKYTEFAAPELTRQGSVARKDKSVEGITFIGTTWQAAYISAYQMEEGRQFTDTEDRNATRITLIGYNIKKNLFPNESAIGKTIKVQGVKFKVIGVLKEQGKFLGIFSLDDIVIVPIKTMRSLFGRRGGYLSLKIKIFEGVDSEIAKDEIQNIMRAIRGLKPRDKDNFAINQQEAFKQQFGSIKMAIGGIGFGITALSLIVGGIGIMNIMFVSVKERTKEIGIRKALGAKRRIILLQFLSEAVVISLIGGLIGILITVGLVGVVQKYFVAKLSFNLILISLSVSVITGIISGIVPA